MSLKHILSAVLLAACGAVFAAGGASSVPGSLAGEIAAVLKEKRHGFEKVSGNPEAAVRALTALRGKDAQATALLGLCYKDGFGTAKNPAKAREAFLAAADMGSSVGQFWAGVCLLRGIGGPADAVKAVPYLESASLQGVANAMLILAGVYWEGHTEKGVLRIPEDHDTAIRFLRHAFAAGRKEAALLLGDWYFKVVRLQDPVQAKRWFKAVKELPHSKSALAEVAYATAANDKEKESAFEDLLSLAEKGNIRACAAAGRIYLDKGDAAKASAMCKKVMEKTDYAPAKTLQALILRRNGDKNWIKVMLQAAEASDTEAMTEAGFYLATTGKKAEAAMGLAMLQRAARRGALVALVKMGRIRLEGKLVSADHKAAFRNFKLAADKGSNEAKYFLSLCYAKGLGTAMDTAEAARYAAEAAAAGDISAMTLYGTYLRFGVGVEANAVEAVKYLEKAARTGNKDARACLSDLVCQSPDLKASQLGTSLELVQQAAVEGDAAAAYALGKMYTEGIKLPRNYKLGFKNYELAVNRKFTAAYAALADYYFNGWGVKADFAKAHRLLAEGKKYHSGEAVLKMGIAKLEGKGVRKDISAAHADFREAVRLGCPEGNVRLGICHAKGIGVSVNAVTACNFYRQAAQAGSSSGMLMLALALRDGIGCKASPAVALRYFREAIKLGNSDAMYEMGLLYANGVLVKKDIAESVKWFKMAAEAGNTYGIYELATCYEHGRGVKKNTAKAASLFREAALGGNRYAQFMLGRCYEGGIGVPMDKQEAYEWYIKASSGPDGFRYAAKRAKDLKGQMAEAR